MPSWYECTAILMSEAAAIQHCAIATYPEGQLLASKGDGRIHDDELMAFVHAFDNTCKERTGYGFILDDIHYKVIYTGRQCIAGRNNSGGFFATKTHSAVIIAVFEGSCPELGEVRNSVDKLADILIAAATQFAMNTWDDYLNDLMSEIKLCAMVSYPDGVLLASKGIGQFRDSELKAFVNTYDKTCEERTGHAFTFDDNQYEVIYTGKHCIVGRRDNGGFFATKTQTAVIIAVFEGSCSELGGVRNAVDNLAENLMGIGY
ncbi:hypothetical protein PRIPAC_87884 [Pristionchus pacificus]|uniref:Profilin n=1 Tax=Pristionchus pacificus TaxID=54126 RepID=A0A2A6B912_PRIPA|nr:hypothetical protein PRIPAC_87884 [Pristionchus pacificus]|eukprot:PDM62369.1 hypothetical protein PRIPAC_51811 [Pristionchus pacificus]